MTEEQRVLWDSNPEEFEKHMLSKIDESKFMLTVTSKINNTESNGKQSKILNIPNTWASGPIQLGFIYGYDNDARSGDSSRMWGSILDIAGWVGLVIWIIGMVVGGIGCGLATVASGGAAAVLCVGLYALIAVEAAEMVQMAYEQYTQGFGAQIGRNKYGCSFPEGAYVHMYSMILINENKDPYMNIDIPAAQNNPSTSSSSYSSIINQKTMLLLGISTGIFLTIWSILGSGSSE
jgi:hypothetical protein